MFKGLNWFCTELKITIETIQLKWTDNKNIMGLEIRKRILLKIRMVRE